MSEEKHSANAAIIAASLTAIATLGTGLFANWEKIFPKNTTPQATTDVTTQQMSATPQATTDAMSASTPAAATLDDGFTGAWSSDQDEQENLLAQVNLSVAGNQISGTIELQALQTSKKKSERKEAVALVYSLNGEGTGKTAYITLVDQAGNNVGKAALALDGETLVWQLVDAQDLPKDLLPNLIQLYSGSAAADDK